MIGFMPDLKRITLIATLLTVPFLYLSGVQAYAQNGNAQTSSKAQTPVTPVVDTVAEKLLKKMSGTLASAKDFSFRADIDFDQLLSSGQQIQYGGVADITVEMPNKVYASFDGDLGRKKIWYTGNEVHAIGHK